MIYISLDNLEKVLKKPILLELLQNMPKEVLTLFTPIERYDFSVRTYNALKGNKLYLLGDVTNPIALLGKRNFGKSSYDEVEELLSTLNIQNTHRSYYSFIRDRIDIKVL